VTFLIIVAPYKNTLTYLLTLLTVSITLYVS